MLSGAHGVPPAGQPGYITIVSYLLYYNMLQHYRHRELPTAVSALSYMEPPLPAPPAFDRLAIS